MTNMRRNNRPSGLARPRIPYRVCRCLPNGIVTHLEARLLRDIVNQAIHPIRCAASCKRKYQKGMYIGDLCAETGHFWWAMKVWSLTQYLIEEKDYEDTIHVWFNPEWVRISDVLSETECELLARRRSDLWRALGDKDSGWDAETVLYHSLGFGTYYWYLWEEKFDYNPYQALVESLEDLRACKAAHETEAIFQEGQVDCPPPCSQDFMEYWHGAHEEEEFTDPVIGTIGR